MTLTDEEIRVKIAELEGWENIRERTLKAKGWHEQGITHGALDYCGVPNWPLDPSAALQLCDRMHSEGWSVEIKDVQATHEWFCQFSYYALGKAFDASDPSLARAICLAFLKAYEN